MKEIISKIIRASRQISRKHTKYLTFAFLEKNEKVQLEFVGHSKIYPKKGKLYKHKVIREAIKPWGHDIPVINLKFSSIRRNSKAKETSCIIVFECLKDYRSYFAIMVDSITSVINLAEIKEEQMAPLLLSAKRNLFGDVDTTYKNIPFHHIFTANTN